MTNKIADKKSVRQDLAGLDEQLLMDIICSSELTMAHVANKLSPAEQFTA